MTVGGHQKVIHQRSHAGQHLLKSFRLSLGLRMHAPKNNPKNLEEIFKIIKVKADFHYLKAIIGDNLYSRREGG